ncbi:HK97 family phage portal protein [Ureibacillus xyleni]|uniref:HK97 family phage portal protein n=1 Tax=Ureibacillus xyleni TaxID=614648 RepID=A0A285SWX6_9BACL|nr:phage portal protein [Ureibacillus xyleni]SOC12855.1 HK97 family phage portal protein [Ureibacillus xyleni]
MKLSDLWKSNKEEQKAVTVSKYQMITDDNNGFFMWNGNIYQSDLIRSIIRVKAKAVSKTMAKHIREDKTGLKVNPEPYMKFLLEEPNELMSMQQLLEKAVSHLELNNNAFIYINRDEYGYPIGLYPITASNVEALRNGIGELFLRFTLKNGKRVVFAYKDIIHLRQDFNENEIFGDSNFEALKTMMEVVHTIDNGIIKAIKNSNVVQWLLKYNANLKPEDLKKSTKEFVDSFLNMDSDLAGAASVDNKVDAQRVEPKSFMPNADQMKETTNRIYSFFNVNEKIIQSSYSENEWISFYESSVEPIIIQLSNEFTRKLFTRKERSFGNKVVFEGSNLSFASMSTKLQLVQMLDRGVMNPNEVRLILNMHPVEHGDEYLLRLDTAKQSEQTKEAT